MNDERWEKFVEWAEGWAIRRTREYREEQIELEVQKEGPVPDTLPEDWK